MKTIASTSLTSALETLGVENDHLYTAVQIGRKWHVRDWGFGHPGSGGAIVQWEDSFYSTLKGFGWPGSCYTYENQALSDPPPWTVKQVVDEIRDVIARRKAAEEAWQAKRKAERELAA